MWTDADGRITRENQSASYPAIAPDVPDANPRGCNKGVQQSQVLYQADRLLHPMRRTGARGEGKWKRISWDEAITEVATHLYETMLETGPAGNYVHMGSGMLSEARAASVKRLGTLLGAVRPYIASYVGDMFPGVSVVYGEGNLGCTYDFVYGIRRGALLGLQPQHLAHPRRPLPLGGQVPRREDHRGDPGVQRERHPRRPLGAGEAGLRRPPRALHHPAARGHEALLRALPQAVHRPAAAGAHRHEAAGAPARRRPRRSALRPEERRALRRRPREAPRGLPGVGPRTRRRSWRCPGCEGSTVDTLRLDDIDWKIDPALSGKYRIRLKGQGEVEVEPAFALLRPRAEGLRAREDREASPACTRRSSSTLARELSGSRVAIVTLGFAVGKHFNGMLSQRAMASLTAFLGKLGPFGGLDTENEWSISGLEGLSGFAGKLHPPLRLRLRLRVHAGRRLLRRSRSFDEADVKRATGTSRAAYEAQLKEQIEASAGDAGEKKGKPWWKEVETFLALRRRALPPEQGVLPAGLPREGEVHRLRRLPDERLRHLGRRAAPLHHVLRGLGPPHQPRLPPLRQRLRPARQSEEGRRGEVGVGDLHPHRREDGGAGEGPAPGHRRRAVRARSPTPPTRRRASTPWTGWSRSSPRAASSAPTATRWSSRSSTWTSSSPTPPRTMVERGGFLVLNEKAGKTSPLYPDRPYNSFENNLYLHQRFETVSGRLTFYVDHPLWIAAGAQIPPGHRAHPPAALPAPAHDAARPLVDPLDLQGRRPTLLRLQRGEPCVMLNPGTAAAKGIADGDRVRLWNDLGEVVRAGQDRHRRAGRRGRHGARLGAVPVPRASKGHNALIGDMPNLLEVSDGWGHLKFGTNWDGNQHAYDSTVDIARA